jgi:RimJ/RimL family protein N-acetyltransferase
MIVALRDTSRDDCELYWDWVNDPEVRKQSHITRSIEWDEHSSWFKKQLRRNNVRMFVAYDWTSIGAAPVGQIRFEYSNKEWNLSYSVDAEYRGQGISKQMIHLGLQQLNVIKAEVKPDNTISNHVFTSLGWVKTGTTYRSQP